MGGVKKLDYGTPFQGVFIYETQTLRLNDQSILGHFGRRRPLDCCENHSSGRARSASGAGQHVRITVTGEGAGGSGAGAPRSGDSRRSPRAFGFNDGADRWPVPLWHPRDRPWFSRQFF